MVRRGRLWRKGVLHLFVHEVIHRPGGTRGPADRRSGARRPAGPWAAPAQAAVAPAPAVVRRAQAANGSSASSRLPSRSTQSASDATAAEAAIPTDVSSMQPRNVRKPSSRARRASARPARAAALGELHVDAGGHADERVEILDRDAALVGDDRQRRARLEVRELVEAARRERLLDELDPEPTSVGQQRAALSGRPAGVGVDPDRPVVDLRTASSVARSLGAADLDLERREVARAPGPLGDDRRLVEAEREVGRRDVAATGPAGAGPARRAACRRGRGARCRCAHFAAPLGRSTPSARRRPSALARGVARSPRTAPADRPPRAASAARRPPSRPSRRRTGRGSPRRARRPSGRRPRRAARRRRS